MYISTYKCIFIYTFSAICKSELNELKVHIELSWSSPSNSETFFGAPHGRRVGSVDVAQERITSVAVK